VSQTTLEIPPATGASGNGDGDGDGDGHVVAQSAAAATAAAAPAYVPAGTDVLTDHAYDGIQEFDNPMPGWWKWLFIGTIAFSVVYCALAVAGNKHISAVASFELARAEEQRLQTSKKLGDDAASLVNYMNDAKVKSAGGAIFAANCALCHKPDGSGQVGPNMTDDAYIHIKAIDDIPRFIRSGSTNGAMPSFARMAPNDIVRAATYVASLRGQNLPGKAAEGVKIPPWGSAAAAPAAGGASNVITATPVK
jgi:cytochrome c oxidase cbb3-type subunit 3